MFQNDQYLKSWEALVGESYDSFESKVLRDLPAGTQMLVQHWGDDFFYVHIDGPKSRHEKDFSFSHMIMPGVYCKSDGANVKEIGSSMTALINRNMIPIVCDLGISMIEISATDVGAYAWSRAGFKPFDNVWPFLADQINRRLDYLASFPDSDLAPDDIDAVKKIVRNPDPRSLWDIADLSQNICGSKLGKILILEWSEKHMMTHPALIKTAPEDLQEQITWNGVCDLTDPDCLRRFMEYIDSAIGKLPAAMRVIPQEMMFKK